ncbi:MAG: DAK2 domain-containing protein [Lachnospiraceae bacterium]|nr:DAK2 domain-containing protein [Lachnospiraceae bacterium]
MNSNEITIDGKLMAACVKAGAARLEKNEALINQLNVFPVPDGDTGSNMLTTLRGGLSAAKNTENLSEYMSSLATGMLFGARGNSGVIFSQIFSGIAEELKGKDKADCSEMLKALENGAKVAYQSVVTPTEGTILTVAREGAEGFSGEGLEDINVWDFFKIYIENIKEALEKTPDLLPILKSAGVVDSGGYGFVKFFEGFTSAALDGNFSVDEDVNVNLPLPNLSKWHDDSDEEAFGFCTECIVTLNDDKNIREETVEYLTSMGKSVVCVQSGNILKLHVHTLEPLKVLGHMQELGVFYNVKIENMDNQVSNNKDSVDSVSQTMKEKHDEQVREIHHGIAYIAVANGDGVIKAFKDFGCEIVLNGGQTMNTSVEEFVEAFKQLDAETIIVMPNNSNIEAAAKQAAKIFGEDRVMILPTKSIAEGYFAMSMGITDRFEAEEVYNQMKQGMDGVDTIWISKAIRDANVDGISCREGDYLALYGKQIVATDPDRLEAVKKVLEQTPDIEDKYVLLVFKGKDVTDEECDELTEFIEDTYDWLDVGIIDGGQEVYDFVIGITG